MSPDTKIAITESYRLMAYLAFKAIFHSQTFPVAINTADVSIIIYLNKQDCFLSP